MQAKQQIQEMNEEEIDRVAGGSAAIKYGGSAGLAIMAGAVALAGAPVVGGFLCLAAIATVLLA